MTLTTASRIAHVASDDTDFGENSVQIGASCAIRDGARARHESGCRGTRKPGDPDTPDAPGNPDTPDAPGRS